MDGFHDGPDSVGSSCSSWWQIKLVLFKAREARLDWNNDVFVFPVASGDVCRCDLFSFCRWLGNPNSLSETSRPRVYWFRHGNFVGTDHREFANDQPRNHWRISGPNL